LARRRSLAMYRAAILAHRGNHLAANELGVGLAAGGHYTAASRALDYAASKGGGSTVYRNLAMVHQRLARPRLAMAAQEQAERLASQERQTGAFSQQVGVQWVDPAAFSRSGGLAPTRPGTPTAVAQRNTRQAAGAPANGAAVAAAPPRGPWRANYSSHRGVRTASAVAPQPTPAFGNQTAAPVRSQTIVR
ncbi:MAG: hypothetical protein AAF596_09870, partial [Planctomycetota bacterium]